MEKRTLSELQEAGYTGQDCNIETALYEYGLLWLYNPNAREYHFIYKAADVFDTVSYSIDIDPAKEFNWVNWHDMAGFTGISINEIWHQPLFLLVADLLSYYGYLNVFGDCHHPFNTINDIS